MITTGELMARNARKYPDREALVTEERRYTYGELNAAVNKLANRFLDLGLEKGDTVAIMHFNTDHYIIAYFAVM